MTSNLIKGLIDNLLHEQGKGVDRVIMKNMQKSYEFEPGTIKPNCLTSLFLLDRDKSPVDSFIKIMNKQADFDNKETRNQILAEAKELGKKNQLAELYYAIKDNYGEFGKKYGNPLFVQALKHVANTIPDENFAVQILSAVTEAKMNATNKSDVEELLKIEENCKPFVYYALNTFICPFKTQEDLQNRVMEYFKTADNGENYQRACDYFRQLGIANIIQTKLADDSNFNINYEKANDKNSSLVYIDYAGIQRFLINDKHPEPKVQNTNITEMVKNCQLIDDGKITRNSKYIQKALDTINKEVVKSYDTGNDKTNFLQTALTFLILLDVEEVKDPFDIIGISIANPISDILNLMQDNQNELNSLIENSYSVADDIVKREKGISLNERYFNQINAGTVANENTNETNSNIIRNQTIYANHNEEYSTPVEEQDKKNASNKQGLQSGTVIIDDDLKNAGKNNGTLKTTNKGGLTSQNKGAAKKPDKTTRNVKFYTTLTKKIIQTISKDYAKLKLFEDKIADHELAKAKGEKVKKNPLTPTEQKKYEQLKNLYYSAEQSRVTVRLLNVMNSHITTLLADGMTKALKNGKEWDLDEKEKEELFLDENQDMINELMLKIYDAYFTFLKNFDNTQRLKLADMYELREKDPKNPLCGVLKYLPPQRIKSNNKNTTKDEEEKKTEEKIVDENTTENENDK